MIHADAHAYIAALDATGNMFHVVRGRGRPHQSADDLQRLPRMGIVISGMKLKPAQTAGTFLRREALGIGLAFVYALRPLAGGPLDGIVGGCDARRQRTAGANLLAPVRQGTGAVRRPAVQHVLALNARAFGPVEPVFGMVLLHADVAHQPAPGQVVAGAAAEAGLEQAQRHVRRETLDHRPDPDHEVTRRRLAERSLPHQVPHLVPHDALLGGFAIGHHVLRPLRVAGQFGERAGTFKTGVHRPSPYRWVLRWFALPDRALDCCRPRSGAAFFGDTTKIHASAALATGSTNPGQCPTRARPSCRLQRLQCGYHVAVHASAPPGIVWTSGPGSVFAGFESGLTATTPQRPSRRTGPAAAPRGASAGRAHQRSTPTVAYR